ncbi:MAG TPA: c-type cytochrome, partial [Planctomycetota bacterium]|nr:c-type cytochrome [Planctomycetota bacterium]
EQAAGQAGALLEPYRELDLQLAAIEALGAVVQPGAEEAAADALLEAWPALGVQAREQAFRQLVERPAKAARLVARIAAGEVRSGELGPQRLHRLRNHPDAEIARRAGAALEAAAPADAAAVEELIERLAPLVDAPGDLERGRALFEQNCASCHAFAGEGGKVGPELDGMGAHGTRELLGFVLDPNRAVEAAYLEYVARTLDGRLVSGVLVREDRETVLLRGSAGETLLRRDEIEELSSGGRSPMPTGFESLGPDGLRDLFAWLRQGSGLYRVIDLRPNFDASTARGLYDRVHDAKPMDFARYGVVEVGGVPFELVDPARSASGDNALVLRGGLVEGWESKTRPQRVEVPVGLRIERVHVLGGIAAWGWPARGDERRPIVRWTWRYGDGAREEVLLHDGVEFADWIRRHDVPGSAFAEGLLREGSWGQVRSFALAPGRDAPVEAIVLESFDDHTAPTFLALTAELPPDGSER